MHPLTPPTPPEIISNQMYTGPGAGSLRAAAKQLRRLADSAEAKVESLSDTLDELSENWKGSSPEWMADAVGRYLDWLSKHSCQIWQTAHVIEDLVELYELTRQTVVPPADIAHNRQEVRRLIASNVAGVNAPEIAQLDARYQQYGARNVLAMDFYLRSTRDALSQLRPWQEPPQIHSSG
ncbi:PPE family protein [Mycobacterium canetti]|uniref:PPE family protein n=1 Tax=Mycobacterium canetti TaxID=78331 RepID=UPI0002A552AC|nr:PPE family protein [Mycobacterium canetti]CCK61564.1 Conserved protein of unknown function, PPE family protein [Mycobacterium canettii CIPT 140070010]